MEKPIVPQPNVQVPVVVPDPDQELSPSHVTGISPVDAATTNRRPESRFTTVNRITVCSPTLLR